MLTDLIFDALFAWLPDRVQWLLVALLVTLLAGGFAIWWLMG